MTYKCILAILLLCVATIGYTQNQELDSLLAAVENIQDYKEKAKTHIEISRIYGLKDSTLSHNHVNRALDLVDGKDQEVWLAARNQRILFLRDNVPSSRLESLLDSLLIIEKEIDQLENKKLKTSNLIIQSSIHAILRDYERTLDINLQLLKGFELESQTYNRAYAVSLFYTAVSYMKTYRLPEALDYYRQLEDYARQFGDDQLLSVSYNNLGVIYSQIEDLDTAIEYDRKSLSLIEDNDQRKWRIIGNLANHFLSNNQLDSFLSYGNILLESDELNPLTKISVFGNMAEAYAMLDDKEKAEEFIQKALGLLDNPDTEEARHNIKAQHGFVLMKQGRAKEANAIFRKAINLYKSENHQDEYENLKAYYGYYFETLFDGQSNFNHALFKEYNEIIDTLKNRQIVNQTIQNEIVYQSQKKEYKIQSLEQESKLTQKTTRLLKYLAGLTGLFLLASLFGVYYYFRSAKTEKLNKQIAEDQNLYLQSINKEMKAELVKAKSKLSSWEQVKLNYLHLPGKEMRKLRLEEIAFIKSDGNGIYIHTSKQKHHVWVTLKNILELLPEDYFSQCHKSYIVNTQRLSFSNSNHLLIDGEIEIPMSSTYKENVLSKLE